MNKLPPFFVSVLFIICLSCNDNSAESTTSIDSNTVAPGDTTTQPLTTENTNNTRTIDEAMNTMMQDMHNMKMTEDPDHDFAMMMKRHHEGAIEMSNAEISSGKNAELKQLAQKIIDDSRKDNADVDAFLNQHQPSEKTDYAKKAMDIMMKKSAGPSISHGNDIDAHFAMMMIRHHKDGIDMSKLYLKSAKQEQAKKVANNVIKANSDDVQKLEKWQTQNKSDTTHSGH